MEWISSSRIYSDLENSILLDLEKHIRNYMPMVDKIETIIKNLTPEDILTAVEADELKSEAVDLLTAV